MANIIIAKASDSAVDTLNTLKFMSNITFIDESCYIKSLENGFDVDKFRFRNPNVKLYFYSPSNTEGVLNQLVEIYV